ncbi:MAG: hypothetical protein U5Q44_01445 [Dehalococcoidia bacterium]|nr:hypothetical protein [Dehalococcoidia bacterium]
MLDAFVGTFLAQQFPAAAVQRTTNEAIPVGNVRVDVWPQQRWMLLSSAPNGDRHYIEALSEGASAVFFLGASLEEFQAALNALLGDRATYVPNELMRWLASSSMARAWHRLTICPGSRRANSKSFAS